MGCDMVVALGQATTEGQTLFGQNCHRGLHERQSLQLHPGRDWAWGEKVRTQFVELPQARKTHTVLGCQPQGQWGYLHGMNQHQLVMGCASLRTKLRCQHPGLLGTDLVRLVLERCTGARQAVDGLANLVERHGQGLYPRCAEEGEGDSAFLLADPCEAFVVETSGPFWAAQELRSVRAVSDVSVIRQDWSRIAPGLAAHAIGQGWWPDDGTKLDFAGALGTAPKGLDSGLRRWGRATLLLAEQNNHLDVPMFRRVLSDHYEETRDEADPFELSDGPLPLCRHGGSAAASVTAASFIAQLQTDAKRLPILWCAFGPPCISLYLPIFIESECVAPLAWKEARFPGPGVGEHVRQRMQRIGGNVAAWALAREGLGRLQAHLDQEAAGFAVEAAALKQRGNPAELHRQMEFFMHHIVEQLDKLIDELDTSGARSPVQLPSASR
jgi:secernin